MRSVLRPCDTCVCGVKRYHVHKYLGKIPGGLGSKYFVVNCEEEVEIHRCLLGINQREELKALHWGGDEHPVLSCQHYEAYSSIRSEEEMELHIACASNDKESLFYTG